MKKLLAALLIAASPLAYVPQPAAAQEQVLNVQNADIRAFIQDVARATGRTFIIDPRVQGTVTVASDEPLSRAELLDVLLSTLRANGLVAVPTGSGAYRVVPDDSAAQQPGTAGGAALGFSTEVFRLKTLDARTAAETLKPLVGKSGVVIANPQSNSVVVADYADNLRRIRGLIAQVDQDRATVETFTLRHTSAREIAGVVNQILATTGGGEGAARNTALWVVPVDSSNSLLLRGDAATVARVRAIVADLDQRAQSSDDVRVMRLQHANATQLLPVLQQVIGQTPSTGAGPDGQTAPPAAAQPGQPAQPAARASIAVFPGANALVISAAPETQRMLAEVVRQLDTRREQVLVEAIVVEVSDKAAKQLGVQYLLAGKNGTIPFSAVNWSSNAPSILQLTGAAVGDEVLPEDSAALEALQAATIASLTRINGGILGIGGETDDALFGMIINAVKSDTTSNVLSTPSVMTLDNEEARILVGQEVPITTGEVLGDANSNPFRTIKRENVGIQLDVKPQINEGGSITLYLRQEVSTIAGPVSADFQELILNKREIETTVLVDDGDIVVLGGLLDQNERVTVQKVPLLGDLPAVGGLFRNTGAERNKTNLMVFIRPVILRDAAAAQALTAPRYDYLRARQVGADGVASLDEAVRGYMGATPPATSSAPVPAPADGGAK